MKPHAIGQSMLPMVLFVGLVTACGDQATNQAQQHTDSMGQDTSRSTSDAITSTVVIDDFLTLFSVSHPRAPGRIGYDIFETTNPLPLSVTDHITTGFPSTRYAMVAIQPDVMDTSLRSANGRLTFNNGPNVGSTEFTVDYREFGVIAGEPTGSIHFDIPSSDVGLTSPELRPSVDITINGITRSIVVGPIGSYAIPLSSFAGLDTAHITAIGMHFSTGAVFGADLSFSNFTIDGAVVPCPTYYSTIIVDNFSTVLSAYHPKYPGEIGVDFYAERETHIPIPTSSFEAMPAGAIGDRHASVICDASNNDSRLSIYDEMSFSNGARFGASTFTITYDGFGFKSLPANSVFHFDVTYYDHEWQAFGVPAHIAINGVSTTISITKKGSYDVPLSRILGVDLNHITSIAFTFGQPKDIFGIDIAFDNFRIDYTPPQDCNQPPSGNFN